MSAVVGDLSWLPYPLPDFGVEVESVSYERRSQDAVLHAPEPEPPHRELWRVDDDGEAYFVRELTQVEMVAARESYERALIEWRRRLGLVVSNGPIVDFADVQLADGRTFMLIGDGKQWKITARARWRD